jgi:hypothetical protein
VVAAHLARFGINCVRFHFLDANWSGGSLFVRGRDDTRALDPKQLDTLDYFVAELKKRGIYTDLNLNVGRVYRKGDGVRDYEYLGMAKIVNYFDEQVQMLHKEYAEQLLTHRNPYTGAEYRHEPAVAIVELVNENSIVEAWFSEPAARQEYPEEPRHLDGHHGVVCRGAHEQIQQMAAGNAQTRGLERASQDGGRGGRTTDPSSDKEPIQRRCCQAFPHRGGVLHAPGA